MIRHKLAIIAAVVAALGWAGCGGSSGSSGSGTTSSADATKAVDSVSVDLSNIDASQSSASANIVAAPKTAKGFGTSAGSTSRAGCELNQIKKEAIRLGKETDAILCYLGTAQDNIPAFVVDGTQRYYSVTAPVGGDSGGNMAFTLRVQKSSGTLMMDMCQGGTLSEELTVMQSGRTVTATGYHYFKGTSGGPGASFEDKGGFDMTMGLKSDAAGDITYADIDSGSLTANFNGTYGRGRMVFSKTSGQDLNDISGVFSASFGTNDSFTGQISGRTDATKGAVKYAVTGTFPGIPSTVLSQLPAAVRNQVPAGYALCPTDNMDSCNPTANFQVGGSCQGQQSPALSCFCLATSATGKCTFTDSGTESFSISTNATTGVQTFTITASNDYTTAVSNMTLLTTSDIGTPAATRGWDCSTTGQTVTSIDASSISFATCDSKINKGFDESDHASCQESKSNEKAQSSNDVGM